MSQWLKGTFKDSHGGRIDREEVRRRAGNAMVRKLLPIDRCLNEAKEWVIIGGGPSINDHVDVIRRLKRNGAHLVSVNKSHDWLLSHGIVPWAHVLLDPKEWVAGYVKRPRKDVRYFVASQCHDSVFEALAGFPVFLWHAGQDFPEGQEPTRYLEQFWPKTPWVLFAGKTTVGLRAIDIGNGLGVERFHLIGFDSSRAFHKLHGYDKPEAYDAASGMITVKNRGYEATFDTNSHMARQYYDFDAMITEYPDKIKRGALNPRHELTVYGSGLLPFYAATIGLHADPECNDDPMKVGGYWEKPAGLKALEARYDEIAAHFETKVPTLSLPVSQGASHGSP